MWIDFSGYATYRELRIRSLTYPPLERTQFLRVASDVGEDALTFLGAARSVCAHGQSFELIDATRSKMLDQRSLIVVGPDAEAVSIRRCEHRLASTRWLCDRARDRFWQLPEDIR